MHKRLFLFVLLFFLLPLPLRAAGGTEFLSRRDGFMLLWQSILRPVDAVREAPYHDLQELDPGYLEITYAKARNILPGGDFFYPLEPLTFDDALLWLLRTRNVGNPRDITEKSLQRFSRRYGLSEYLPMLSKTIVEQELRDLMRQLDTFLREEVHVVSFYASEFHGDHTAFGEIFDMNALTAAHRTLPHNTLVRVTNVENGKSVTVRINDRGPYVSGRDMDLSLRAFEAIAHPGEGVIHARFQRLGDARLVSVCEGVKRYQRRITRSTLFHRGIPHVLPLGETLTLRANRTFVVRRISYPDGNMSEVSHFVRPEESFSFQPSLVGEYTFLIGLPPGRAREFRMKVEMCQVGSVESENML